jgi:hypothetical protein
VGEDHDRIFPTAYQQPRILNHNRQVIGHADCVCTSDAPLAENGLPDGQVVRLARLGEPIAGVTVLRLLGYEAGLVILARTSRGILPRGAACITTTTGSRTKGHHIPELRIGWEYSARKGTAQ